MSESLSNDHNEEIRAQVREEFSMTSMRIQFFLEDHGEEFLPSQAAQAEAQDNKGEFIARVRQTVAEQETALGRMLTDDELTEVMNHYYAELDEKMRRLDAAASNSLVIIDITQKIMCYWNFVHNGSAEAAAKAKLDLYTDIKERGLTDAWYALLDSELGPQS